MSSTEVRRPTVRRGPPRYQRGPITTALQLGPLASLPGSWRGDGFNAIWRPDNRFSPENVVTSTHPAPIRRFLELNLTSESFDFQVIPGAVPNRGVNNQPDIDLYGLHYLQRVTDSDPPPTPPGDPPGYSQTAGQGLHLEPGLFMNVPSFLSTVDGSEVPSTIVRLASIPHGVSVMMQGPNPGVTPTPGKPVIPPIAPFAGYAPTVGVPPASPPAVGLQPVTTDGGSHPVPEVVVANDLLEPNSNNTMSSGPFPATFQPYVNDPNQMLRDAIAHQDILGFIALNLTSDGLSTSGLPLDGIGSGVETIGNIPFLGIPFNQGPDPSATAGPPYTNFDGNVALGAQAVTPSPTLFGGGTPAPNLNPNAFVYSASSTFWIEWVRIPYEVPAPDGYGNGRWREADGDSPAGSIEPFWRTPNYLQLQYSQTVIMIFNGVLWPHVSVATMRLSAG